MAELPSGTVTFLFTDLEGSTRLWERHPEAMRDALARHDAILREAVESHRGVVFSEMGDGIAAAFASAADAVAAGLDAQLGLGACEWGETGPLRARMGLHAGEGEVRPDGQYVNQPLNRCARLMAIANGGQVLVSQTVESLVRGALPTEVGLLDLGEHRLRDLARPIGVFQVTHRGLPRDFPPLRSLDVLPGNLPVQVTSFVGREEERTRVAGELGEARVVTLTGVGGVGKTRLALEVAADAIPEYGDGAWLCELSGVRDPDAVPDAMVAMFGLQPRTGLTATEVLLEFLRAKELLLVLDNCEHLLKAVAGLVDDVVRACPRVRVLATSREGLNVAGERMLGVASLDVPGEAAELDAITQCEAVVLFVERARALKSSFALDATNAREVAQICRRLDGIALAIELAAARVAMLTPAEVARRLDQRFRLLAGGQRTAVERHQTLRAAIDWSYDLLSESEQCLLGRLSIFAGGFTLEAAEGVTAGGDVNADEVFELLASLVARSLVVADTEGIEARYRLLETIRQYAQERLDTSGDGDRLRSEHARYYAGFAEAAIPNLTGPDGLQWESRFEREFDNFRTALTWAVDTRDVDTALRVLGMWEPPMMLTDVNLNSTLRWAAETVLAIPGASDHPRFPAALVVIAWDANRNGDHELAEGRCDEALAAEQRLGTEPSISLWLARGHIALAQGHLDEAIDHAKQAARLSRARGDTARLAIALATSAGDRAMVGDSAGALTEAEEAMALARSLGNPRYARGALAMAAFALGDSEPERALALVREAIELSAGTRTPVWAIAGDLATRHGNPRDALDFFSKAIDDLHWFGMRPVVGSVLGRVADLLADDDPEAAAVIYGAADALAPEFVLAPHVVEARQQATATLQASLGGTRPGELRAQGMAMDEDDAVAYAQAAINRCLSEGPP
jgi:predicted ATPase/class 3 adenylate cyclase